MSKSQPVVYLGGKLIPAPEAHVKIYDASVILGATVTDMTRTFRHEPFRLEDHVARFYRSCRYTSIQPRITAEQTAEVTRELVRHNASLIRPEQELGIVHFISPGEFPVYAGSAGMAGEMAPTYCIHSFPLPFQLWQPFFDEGVHLVTPSIRHVPPQCVDPKIKCRSRMHWWLADQQTHLVDPKAVTLLLDLDGNVTETSGSNVVIVREGQVITPSRRHILWGISLTTLAELCQQLRIPFVERDVQLYDVVNADEVFLTTTPYCMAPATRINQQPIGTGKPGPIFERLIGAWSARVGVDILAQIRSPAAQV